MEQSQKPFKLPNLAELKVLTEDQLKPIFFELERHRASQVHDACEDCRERLERIQKEYDNDFQMLANVLAQVRTRTA